MVEAKRVLILAPTMEVASVFSAPAEKLALGLTLGCAENADLRLDFSTRDAALAIVTYAQREPFAAVIAVGDDTAPVAARAASMLGLPFHIPKAADACRDKQLLARKLEAAGLSWEGHDFSRADKSSPSDAPLGAEVSPSTRQELACDCIMSRGRLRVLAVTERGSVVPAQTLPADLMQPATDALRRLIALLGLKHGPVRASFRRVSDARLCVDDISCAYVPGIDRSAMRFSIPLVDQDVSFEELVLRNALDLDTSRVLLVTDG